MTERRESPRLTAATAGAGTWISVGGRPAAAVVGGAVVAIVAIL